uniref:Putative secreted protein n=1 Tax=Panstrongylus lignarius TaxID=156445 RepID=A0A224XUE3_9HEMI
MVRSVKKTVPLSVVVIVSVCQVPSATSKPGNNISFFIIPCIPQTIFINPVSIPRPRNSLFCDVHKIIPSC